MKKLLFLAVCLLSYTCVNAQIYTAGHMHIVSVDSMSNDSAGCTVWDIIHYNITIDSSYAGETLNIVDTTTGGLIDCSPYVNTTGASPWTITTCSNGRGIFDLNLFSGYAYFQFPPLKVTCGLDTFRYIINMDTLLVTNSCLYDTVQGHVYIDNNTNCINDSGDVGLYPVYPYVYDSLSNYVQHIISPYPTWSATDGYYLYLVQKSWMVDYTIALPPYYAFIFPFSPCFTSPVYSFGVLPQSGVDFPLQCTSLVDVQCNALSPGRVRLHRPFYMQPYVTNTGCDSVSGEMHFIKDHHVIYDPLLSAHPADSVHGDTLIWNYSGLSNLSDSAYWNSFLSDIYLTPDITVVVGDSLCFSGYANLPLTDVNPANNSFSFCLPVVYSFDPNSKEVSPTGIGPEGYIPIGHDTLTYTLHFQNTGSDVAENIKIIDTLDPHINAKSLRVLGTSHNMTPEWLTANVVQFNFNEINLPDSSANEAASHGQVQFSVIVNGSLPVGTPIKNTGYIYFDENAPVVTNTTLNTIDLPSGITRIITSTGIVAYPNPASDQLVVENLDGGEISVLNLNGTVMTKQLVAGSKATIDVTNLPAGVYILKTVSSTNTVTIKFTKY